MALEQDEALELAQLKEQLRNCKAELEAQQARYDRAQQIQWALYCIAEAASAVKDMHEFYVSMHRIVGELMYAENFFIALYDEENDLIIWPYYVDKVDAVPPAPTQLKDHRGATGWVLRHGKTIADVDGSWAAVKSQDEAQAVGTESEGIAVPLRVEDKTLGVILVQSYIQGVGYQLEDVKVLEFVAQHIATALTRAQAIEETRRRNAELAVINSIQEGLVSELEIQAIIDLVGNKIQEIFNVSEVEIALYNPDTRLISIPFWSVQGGRIHQEPLPLGNGMMSHLIQTRQPLIMTAENQEWVSQTAVMPDGLKMRKSFIGSPIISGDDVIGAISLHEPLEENAYDEADLRLLTTVANSMAVALKNARLFEQTQRLLKETEQRNAELGILNSVGEAMAKSLDVKTITHIIGERLRDIFNAAEMVDIQLFDSKTNLIQPSFIFCGVYYDVEQEPAYPLGSNLTSYIIRSQKPLLFHTTREIDEAGLGYDRYATAPEGYPDPDSYMAVPIIAGDQVIGVVDVQSYQPNAFDDNSLRLLQTLSANMGVAIQNARLFEETQRLLQETEQRNEELAIINSVQTALASKLDFRGIVDSVGNRLAEIFLEENVGIGFLDKANDLFRVHYLFENGKRIGNVEFPLGDKGLVSHIFKTRQPLLINTNFDQRADEIGVIDVSGEPNPKSWLGVPIIVNDEVIGVFSLQNWARQNAYTDADVRLLQTLGSSLGVALENARLFAEVQTRNQEVSEALEQQTATSEVLRALSGFQPDLRSLLEIIAANAAKVCGADDAHIYRIEGEALIEWTHRGPIPGLEAGESLPLNRDSVIGRAIVERQIIHMSDAAVELDETEYPISALLQRRWGYRTVLATPLLRDGEPIGGIAIRRKEVQPFTEKQIKLIKTFADQAVIAIENVRLFEETQRLLKDTQQRASELAILNRVGQGLVEALDYQTIIELVGYELYHVFVPEETDETITELGIGLYDEKTNLMQVQFWNKENGSQPPVHSFPLGPGLHSQVMQTRQPIVTGSIQEQAALGAVWFDDNGGPYPLDGSKDYPPGLNDSWLGVPIVAADRVLGVLSIQDNRFNQYSESDVRLLSTMASNMGVALENARLFDEIRRQKQYYETIIANSPAAIVVIDLDLNVTGWNPAAERLFGYSGAEALGRNIDDLVARNEEIHAEALRFSQEGLTANPVRLIAKRSRKDGALVDVELMGLPISIDGDKNGYLVIYHDITELQRARQEAIAANQAKSNFLANMSHELRTPLNAIIGFTRIVHRRGEGILPEKQLENLDKVLASSEHLIGLINTVLDISKIEAGRMDVQPTTFELTPLVDLVVSTSQPLVRPGVRLVAGIPPDLPPLYTDLDKFKQILINLLSNAAKFTHQGEISVSARQNAEMLSVQVRDSGIGVSPEAQDHIFDEFQQADSSTTRQYGGTGLGLSISRKLAHLLGGDLTMTSQVGAGSTFTLTIPICYSASPVTPAVSKPLAALSRLARRQPASLPRQLLVVDDDPNVSEMISQLLDGMPYEIDSAADGQLALEAIQRNAPEAILLDLLMPGMDGFSLIAALRENPRLAAIPVIVLTAKSLSATERELLQDSVARVIEKQGLESTVLLDEIQRVLSPQG